MLQLFWQVTLSVPDPRQASRCLQVLQRASYIFAQHGVWGPWGIPGAVQPACISSAEQPASLSHMTPKQHRSLGLIVGVRHLPNSIPW